MAAYTGHQTEFRRLNAQDRSDIGKNRAPDVVPAYNPRKDKAIVTPQWERVANGYDWNCGMQDKAEWLREFEKLVGPPDEDDLASVYESMTIRSGGMFGEEYHSTRQVKKVAPVLPQLLQSASEVTKKLTAAEADKKYANRTLADATAVAHSMKQINELMHPPSLVAAKA